MNVMPSAHDPARAKCSGMPHCLILSLLRGLGFKVFTTFPVAHAVEPHSSAALRGRFITPVDLRPALMDSRLWRDGQAAPIDGAFRNNPSPAAAGSATAASSPSFPGSSPSRESRSTLEPSGSATTNSRCSVPFRILRKGADGDLAASAESG